VEQLTLAKRGVDRHEPEAGQYASHSRDPSVIMEQASVPDRPEASPSSGILAVFLQRERRELHP
jgi:hypothetical protein